VELEKLFGLPAHPLIVHLPVVLVPLAAVGAVLALAVGRWRYGMSVACAVLGVVAAVAAQLAVGSGESLEEVVGRSPQISEHAQLGEQARTLIGVFALAMVAWVAVQWWLRRQAARPVAPATARGASGRRVPAWLPLVLALASVVGGVAATAQVVRAGHSGAKSAWEDAGKD
jgi:uncharacterized membrane protein